jgi:hypothetical protein
MRSVLSVLLLVVVGSGCSDSLIGANVAGSWTLLAQPPGNARTMGLTQHGSSVSGAGTWCGELIGCGTTTISGTASGREVHLDIIFDSGATEHFDGELNMFSFLEGSMFFHSPGGMPQLPFAARFKRF